MLFTLGLAAYGVARILTGRCCGAVASPAPPCGWPRWSVPHVAGMVALGLAVAYMVGRPSRRLAGRR